MHSKQSQLFQTGTDSLKREIQEAYVFQIKKQNSNEDSLIGENIKKLTHEVATIIQPIVIKQNDKAIQCEDRNYDLMNSLLKLKDKSIEEYQRQILSFKNMIIQIDHQKKKLLDILEKQDPLNTNQIGINSQNTEKLSYKQMISKSQQTEIDFGIKYTQNQVNSQIISQKFNSKSIQTESKFYTEINMLDQDEIHQEIEQYKVILREYDLENRKLKQQIQQLQQSKTQINKDTQTVINHVEQVTQIDDEIKTEFDKIIQEFNQNKNLLIQINKQYNQQTKELDILRKQYDSILSDYYFIQSENKVYDKTINQLNDEIEQLRLELQTKDQSISSADTLTSPNDSLRSYKKKGSQFKLNFINSTYFNPQNIDELILVQQENQILIVKISELKSQLLEVQRNQKNMIEEINQKDDLINFQQQELQKYQNDQKDYQRRMENLQQFEQYLLQKENQYQFEMQSLQQQMNVLNQENGSLKIINQTLHKQLDKYQIKRVLQLSK
ncbi:unnamed protein product [Paramecium sonneborni]|uniref:Uncharacterized protein n=1 Tax=Paramecium sonneborni TaxID=65129 RepID=A0A8S1NTB1_9CILI|nr:unnamed protein product [Paramecium sonneborni]